MAFKNLPPIYLKFETLKNGKIRHAIVKEISPTEKLQWLPEAFICILDLALIS